MKASLAGYPEELFLVFFFFSVFFFFFFFFFAVSPASEETQTEPLDDCRVHSETTLQIIGVAVSVRKS